uniref:Uncharacterized protein n=1 Tax=Parascaris equorum TaxID=6256 RepID=A0A914S384_PAREQ
MEGALRIGAVNCAEDPILCQSQNVVGYPSLVLYPENAAVLGERIFAVEAVIPEYFPIARQMVPDPGHVVLITCGAMLRSLANVGTVSCFEGPKRDELCVDLGRSRGVAYYPAGNISKEQEKVATVFSTRSN